MHLCVFITSEEFAIGLQHPGEKGRMAPTHPFGKQILEQGKGSITWSFFYRKNCTEQTGAGCSSHMLRVEIFNINYYDNNNDSNTVGKGSS